MLPLPHPKQYLSARGSGILSLHNLGYMAEHFPETFDRLMHKRTGTRSEWEYPFAAAGVNLTFSSQVGRAALAVRCRER